MTKEIIRKFSSGGVIYDKGKYLTIVWGSEGTTELPKGTIEEGETPEETCVREVLEETGYNVKIVKYLDESTFTFDWHDGKTYKKTVYYYLLERADELAPEPQRLEHEDFENQWLSADEAYKALTYDDAKAILQLAIKNTEDKA